MNSSGVDGCRAGWVCVRHTRAGLDAELFDSAERLFAQRPHPDALAIDIPIGLPERGARPCDRAARKRLGPRRSSVFPAPPRSILRASSYDEACAMRFQLEAKRLSKQAWGIVAKIREVDAALEREPSRAAWVREVHPEVSFRAASGAPMQHAKKKRPGREERLALVARLFGVRAFDDMRARFTRHDVADDDLLDAFAALWSAERISRGAAELVTDERPLDARGLRMEIVY